MENTGPVFLAKKSHKFAKFWHGKYRPAFFTLIFCKVGRWKIMQRAEAGMALTDLCRTNFAKKLRTNCKWLPLGMELGKSTLTLCGPIFRKPFSTFLQRRACKFSLAFGYQKHSKWP